MRTSILAIVVGVGTTIALPAQAQQSTATGQQMQPNQKVQDEADKGIKTRNSGESGLVADQEKPGAAAHPPGQPDKNGSQTTTGMSSGTQGGKAGDVNVREQEQKPASTTGTTGGTSSAFGISR
jgi:hypothetical protein